MKTFKRSRVQFFAGGLLCIGVMLPAALRPDARPPPGVVRVANALALTSAAKPSNAVDERVSAPAPGVRGDYIIQASSAAIARRAVEEVGGVVVGDLDIIRAVGAALDAREFAALIEKDVPGLRVYEDGAVRTSSVTSAPETYYPSEVEANSLHAGGVTGRGVTVAVVDTGLWSQKGPLQATSYGRNPRVLAQYDVILAREQPNFYPLRLFNKYGFDIDDPHGHGTHVSSVIASSAVTQAGRYQGVAPGVNLVSVRALNSEGVGRYFDVIRGIQWVVSNKATFGIRVLNLSLSGPAVSHYWEDPLNQAVMSAWSSGLVVVAAAGNAGPSPMTIGVPGNVPYVITVGAVTDNYRPLEQEQYSLAWFSSAGPTYEGFVKPEVVSMGGHLRAYAPDDGTLALAHPTWVDSTYRELTISGTSQAAAVTSGVVALMLERSPLLQPDAVKCRLMSSARPAVKPDGKLAYSVFQQGAGLVDAQAAVASNASGCANVGLNVLLDLGGVTHFGGRANQDEDGNFYLMEVANTPAPGLLGTLFGLVGAVLQGIASILDGSFWDGTFTQPEDFFWSDSYTWGGGFTWSNGYTWSDNYTWGSGFTWSNNAAEEVYPVTSQQE